MKSIIKFDKNILFIVCIGFFIYANFLFNNFVWDDSFQIVQNYLIYSLKNIPSLFTLGQGNYFYRPVTFTLLTIIYSFFGPNVFFFHIVQLIIHILNALLVYKIFQKFFKKQLSFFLSLIFLIHPINAEAVNFMSAICDPLAVFFGLSAFYLMMREKISRKIFISSALLILLALFSKESAILLLIIIVVYNWFILKRSYSKLLIFASVPLSIYLFFRFFVAHIFFEKTATVPIGEVSLVIRLITLPKIFFFYISNFFVPVHLAIAQHWIVRAVNVKDFYFPLIIDFLFLLSLVSVGIFIYRNHKKLFFAFLFFSFWFLISISLYSQIISLDMTVAERWFYLPMIGLLGIFGVVAQTIKLQNLKLKSVLTVIMLFIFIVFSLRTIVRNTNWYDQLTLNIHDEQINKDSWNIEANIAAELLLRGQYDTSLPYAEKSVQLETRCVNCWTILGTIYFMKKEYKKADVFLLKAIKIDDHFYPSYYFLVYDYLLMEDFGSAKKWSKEALKKFPENEFFLQFLAIAEYNLGNKNRALQLATQLVDSDQSPQNKQILQTIKNNLSLKVNDIH